MKARMGIEQSERDTILGQLRRKRKWTTTRNGIRVRIWTEPSQHGAMICWQVFPKRHVSVTGKSLLIAPVIEGVNNAINPSPREHGAPVAHSREEKVFRMPPAPRDLWLPYVDN